MVNVIHAIHIAFVVIAFRNAMTRENVVDLANSNDVQTSCLQMIQISLTGWLQAEVMPVSRSDKVILVWANVWSCNNPANRVFRTIDQCPRITADAVELFNRNHVFMRRNLQH